MRVLRLVERLPPARGGKEVHAAELSRALAARGVQQRVICRKGAPLGEGIPQSRVRPGLATALDPLPAFCAGALRIAERRHRDEPFDLVHAHGDFAEAGATALLARRLGVPAVLSVHGGLSEVGWHDLVRLGLFSALEAVWAVSGEIAERLRAIGVSCEVKVRPSAVREAFFRASARPEDPATLVTVGRLAPVKGLETLIEARDLLHGRRALRWVVVAGGDSRYADEIRRRIAERPDMECRQEDDPDRLASLVASAAAFVLPSLDLPRQREGVPTALLEALAARTPVVATESGGVSEILLGGEAGLLVPPADAEALARAVERTLDEPEAAGARAQRAHEAGHARSWDAVAAEVESDYGAIVTRFRRPGVVFALPWLDVGGAEKFALTVVRGCAQAGDRACVAAAPGRLVDQLSGVAEFAPLHRLRSPGDVARNAVAVAGACARLRPRAVNSHHIPTGLVCRAGAALARLRPRHVLTIHTTEDPRMAPVVGIVGSYCFDRVLLVARSVRDEFIRFAPPWRRERFGVVRAGLEPPEPVSPAERTVGAVARMVQRKGHRVLLDAWARVAEDPRGRDWTLELWGDGPEREALEAQAGALGVDRSVRFAGGQPDAAAGIGRFPVVVLPAHREGLPLVLMEAMAAGCAVIASDLPGCRELVGEAGVLVPAGDPDALAAGLLDLLEDPGRRRELGERARERVRERFSRERMVRGYREELELAGG